MPAYNKFNAWSEYMVEGANLGSDQFAVALTNTAPSATNSVIADITQISYTGLSSRNLTTTSSSQTSGAFALVFGNLTLTTSSTTPSFRYVVIFDDTLAGDPLVGWYDLGASMVINPAESLVLSGMGLDLGVTFTPASLYTGGFTGGWYDPSDITTLWQNSGRTTPVTASGDPVGAIDDKSGNGNHLLQATTSLKPIYRDVGGLKYLDFDGVDDLLQSANVNFSSTSQMAMFCANERQSVATRKFLVAISTNPLAASGAMAIFNPGNNATNNIDTYARGASADQYKISSNSQTTTYRTVIYSAADFTGTSYATETFLRINGVDVGYTSAGSSDIPTTTFSSASPIYVQPQTGYVYGIVVVGKMPSATEITNTETWLNAKAGL